MAKKLKEIKNKYSLYLVAIVAIVAIVGIVVMVSMPKSATTTGEETGAAEASEEAVVIEEETEEGLAGQATGTQYQWLWCSDTDGGNNKYVPGIISYGFIDLSGKYITKSIPDKYNEKTNTVSEGICSNFKGTLNFGGSLNLKCSSKYKAGTKNIKDPLTMEFPPVTYVDAGYCKCHYDVDCPKGKGFKCENGDCICKEGTCGVIEYLKPAKFCYDSDGGKDYTIKGKMILYLDTSISYLKGKDDFCNTVINKTYSVELFCGEYNNPMQQLKDCAELLPYNSHVCVDGACVKKE